MENRYYFSVMKQCLSEKAQANPPLFPWETSLQEYPENLWLINLQELKLPIDLPENVLESLFVACQNQLHSLSQKGRQLVQSVETLFPEPDVLPQLNDMTGMMLLGATRDESEGNPKAWILGKVPPANYESASPQQKMALALLAAEHILFDRLTLDLSPAQPTASSQWATELGTLRLHAQHRVAGSETFLDLAVEMPDGGTVQVERIDEAGQSQWETQGCETPETLDWSLPLGTGQMRYPIKVHIEDIEFEAHFMVQWSEEEALY